jgi:hypothetical protein
MGRYEFDSGPLVHVSETCIVVFGADLEGDSKVALKFMRDHDSFDRENQLRHTQQSTFQDAVIQIEDTYVREVVKSSAYDLGWNRLGRNPANYPCCIVMPKGDRALQDVVSGWICGGFPLIAVPLASARTPGPRLL